MSLYPAILTNDACLNFAALRGEGCSEITISTKSLARLTNDVSKSKFGKKNLKGIIPGKSMSLSGNDSATSHGSKTFGGLH